MLNIFYSLFCHENSNCWLNLFREFFRSFLLDRPRHSSLEINIFSTGTNTWFLTIDHRSITNLVQDSSPPQKIPSCFSPVYLAKKIRGDAPSHVYWKKIYQRNLQKRHNWISRQFSRGQYGPASGRLTFVRGFDY